MEKKMLPIGIESFEKFSSMNYYYIDKTMFIAELLHNLGEVNLFTRPRRFGKTLTMDTLKCFFEIGTDTKLFEGLKISQETQLCEKYMGQYPVISITLKSVHGGNYQMAIAALRRIIGKEALRLYFLKESSQLTEEEKKKYSGLIKMAYDENYTMNNNALLVSLKTLCQLLSKHYGKKAILLIDEYDVPLNYAYQKGYYEEMVECIRCLFENVLKTNHELEFAVITGYLRIPNKSIFTGLNNLNVMTIMNKLFRDSFGFTEDEVREMLAYYGCEDAIDTIHSWYDGYNFAGMSIYCPWDIIKFIQEFRSDRNAFPENYWANTSGNEIVRRFIDKADNITRQEIEQLIAGKSIRKTILQELTYGDLDSNTENLWSVLLMTGYLTVTERISSKECRLSIPNGEIHDLFVTEVKDWFTATARADLPRIEKFCTAFASGNVSQINEMLRSYLRSSICVYDTAFRKSMKENFYHDMVLRLLESRDDWTVSSNTELGEGYSEIVICTMESIGIVIELKYADDGNLEKGCAEALEQIEEKKYAADLDGQEINKVIKYGMAFYKKRCLVVMAE